MVPLRSGDPAPSFSVADADSRPLSLADFRGQVLILYFYPKADTTGCTREAQDFSALAKDFAALGAAVLGVSPDPVRAVCRFREKYGLAVTLAADEGHVVADRYGVWVEKSMYGRKYMGVERTTFLIGSDGVIRHIWRKVKVPGHAAEVLAAVHELTASGR